MRTPSKFATALSIAALSVAMAGTAFASEAQPIPRVAYSASVSVSGMVFVPEGTLTEVPLPPSSTLTVSAPSPILLEAKIALTAKDLQAKAAETTAPEPGDVTPLGASHTAFGTCGTSTVILRKNINRQGYVEASFKLKPEYVGSAYTTDVLLFSDSIIDGWTGHLMDSGVLRDGTNWKNSTRFSVPKSQTYGATLVVAEVAVVKAGKAGVCQSGGPRVTGVDL